MLRLPPFPTHPSHQTHELLAKLLGADYPDVRAAAVFTLGAFVQAQEGEGGGIPGAAGLAPPPASPSPTSSAGGSMPSAAGGEAAAGAAGGAAAEGPLPPAERLAIERAIACALLEVVYDASSLVRCVLIECTGPLHAPATLPPCS